MNTNKWLKPVAVLLALLLLAGGFLAAASANGGASGRDALRAGAGQTAQWDTLARSKKKKQTTPTPAVTEAPTPEKADASAAADAVTPTPVPEGPIIDPQSIADYIFANGCLPDNFITKREAQALGWDSYINYVSDVAPGKSIGGDYFGNYEGKLPRENGVKYYEADCWYTGGRRNAYRVIFSNRGRVWYTEDHYNTFTELFPTVP